MKKSLTQKFNILWFHLFAIYQISIRKQVSSSKNLVGTKNDTLLNWQGFSFVGIKYFWNRCRQLLQKILNIVNATELCNLNGFTSRHAYISISVSLKKNEGPDIEMWLSFTSHLGTVSITLNKCSNTTFFSQFKVTENMS